MEEADQSFQITRARGARRLGLRGWGGWLGFNSRAHGARDRGHRCFGGPLNSFNSRAHGARDLRQSSTPGHGQSFNSRAHGARDPRFGGMAATFTLFQFTRARGARRAGRPDVVHGGVSIHARTGRATFWDGSVAAGSVFQFTRARGARQTSTPPSRGMAAVSIHARTGRATGILLCHEHGVLVSIHARTGRATSSPFRPWSVSAFQFTRARGARLRKMRGKTRIGRWRGECSGTGADGKCAKKAHNGLFSCHRTGAGRREPTGVGMWAWGSRRGKKGQMDRRSVSGSGAGLAP